MVSAFWGFETRFGIALLGSPSRTKWTVIDALNKAVYKEFTRMGIEIPYAKQDLYIKGLPDTFGAMAAEPPACGQPRD